MSYQHDIFISYRRNPETYDWITHHFVPLLTLRVELELGRRPVVFVDKQQVESGASWPISLGTALGCSRVLIPLWSANYLASIWCTEELSQMLAREEKAGLRSVERPYGLVIPAFIHDGEHFPPDLGHIQPFEVQKCFNVRMARNSPRAEELDAILTSQAPAIAACIQNAPPWRKVWETKAATQFFKRFYQQTEAVQTTVPRFAGR